MTSWVNLLRKSVAVFERVIVIGSVFLLTDTLVSTGFASVPQTKFEAYYLMTCTVS